MLVRVNLGAVALEETVAHGGRGTIRFRRVADGESTEGSCNFIDLAVLPPGASIGRHTHSPEEEEFYLVLSGSGRMVRDGEELRLTAGDLVRNRPGGTHQLENDGDADLRIFVFEVRAP